MIFLLVPWLAALLPNAISAIGGIGASAIQRGQSKRDIAAQNAYNSPVNQVARLRQAGLPLASLDGTAHAGSQSALPQSQDGGLRNAGDRIGNYISTQTQLQQLELLKAQTAAQQAEAGLKGAEAKWLLSGKGVDTAGTNLTAGLGAKLGIEQANEQGKQIANDLLQMEKENKPYRLNQENKKLDSEIENILKNSNLLDKTIHGKEIENKIQQIKSEYQSSMSNAELESLLKRNRLIEENITGTKLDNALSEIRNRIAAATETSEIEMVNTANIMSNISLEEFKAKFQNYQDYQHFVQIVQDRIKRDGGGWQPWEDIKAIISLAYTSIAGPNGATQTGAGNILQGMGRPTPHIYKNTQIHNYE